MAGNKTKKNNKTNMKKYLFYSAIAVAALSSCSSENEIAQDITPVEDGAVRFGVYVDRNTRAASFGDPIANTIGLKDEGGFGVFAYDQGTKTYTTYSSSSSYPNFMYNQNVKSTDGTNWTYDPIKYFNNNEGAKHSFFAYAPYQASVKSIFALGNAPAIRYTAGVDTYDLMWAAPYVDIPKIAVDQKLEFNFKHALSQVNIYVCPFVDKIHGAAHNTGAVLDEFTKIKVRSVKFVGTVASQGLLNLNDGTWRFEATEESAYEINDESLVLDNTNDITTTGHGKYKEVTENMMVIPTLAGQPIQIQVVYDVVTTDEHNSVNSSTITNTITSVEKFDLVKGTAYNFYLDLGMTSAKFNAAVTKWTTSATDHYVDLPNNNDFHYCPAVALTAAPTEATHFSDATTAPETPVVGDYWYNPAENKLLVCKTAGKWDDADPAAASTSFYTANAIYTVGSTAGVVTKIEKTEYFSVTSGSTSWYAIGAPTTALVVKVLNSLTVDSKGQIDIKDEGFKAPTNNAYYTFDGKLYQWKDSSHGPA